ncbi:hypothetical protein [Rhodoplanes azumiensis]|uniref:Uncharacterized protein n=1 Tax=Rhodoplanes azumiensis TaxID=1897628 RepID=A0ABW5AFP7_9BRAD
MFEGITLRWQARLDTLVKSGVWGAITALASFGTLVFLGAAVFVLAREEFGTVATSLGFAGFFLLVALIGATGLAVIRRRAARREAIVARSVAAAAPPWWMDPRLVTTGLALGRSLGGRRMLSLGLVGAFVVGLVLSRGVDRH